MLSFILACACFACLIVIFRLRRQLSNQSNQLRKMKETFGSLESDNLNDKQQLDNLLESMQEVVFRLDLSGRVLAANRQALKIFPKSQQTILQQPFVMFYRDPEWNQALASAIQKLPDSGQLPNLTIDQVILSPKLVKLGDHQAVLICMDITSQHQLQRHRENFITNLMHDLKTPLTSLLGYARSIEAFGDNAEIRNEAAKVIAEEAKHVNTLLDALLSIEQIEHQHTTDNYCNSSDICKRVWKSLTVMMEEKEMRLKLDMDDGCDIHMASSDCYRVILNIAENAIHYSPKNTKIRCSLQGAKLIIQDQGSGIAEKHMSRVTERFYRADESRKRGGHGLGLAITHELLQRDGGSLKLRNRIEGGLKVTVLFPVSDKKTA